MAYNTKSTPLATKTRTITQSSTSLPSKTRTITGQPPLLQQVNMGDTPIFSPSKAISGTVYGLSGVPVAGATVKLVRQVDDRVVQVGTTDGLGHYFFPRDTTDILTYYVIAYTSATTPQVHGVSDRGGVPT